MKLHKNLKIAVGIELVAAIILGFLSYSGQPCQQGWSLKSYKGVYNCPFESVNSGLVKNLELYGFFTVIVLLLATIIWLTIGSLRKTNRNLL